jgi:hypothetical protein
MKSFNETTAAYAVSQPLFDALRLGVDRANDQHALLDNASWIIQQIHVKLAIAVSERDASQQSKSITGIVKAWQTATKSFAEIFDALEKATAAVPSEVKEAFEGHDDFVKMAAMAAEANGIANGFSLWKDQSDQSEDGEAEASESASEAESHNDMPAGEALRPPLLLSKEDKKGAKTRQRIENSRQKREKKLLALRAKMKQSQNKSTPNRTDPVPVDYEDISAEVEARLKAKEAKREAAKKDKKRKRESGESFNSAVAAVENEKKPARKKNKANGLGNGGERNVVAVKAKRKQDISTTAEVGGRKRKRARTKS